jgi:type II secretory pathway pseudopilin PulG
MKISCDHLKFVRRERNSVETFPLSRAFTLIEIALCLAIIGFALLAIIIVLPYGMGTQRDNREETIIGQDAAVLMAHIRNGSRGADDLTNYVYALTNYWTFYDFVNNTTTTGVNGYTTNRATDGSGGVIPYHFSQYPLNSGSNIVGLLSTPQFTDGIGYPIRKLDPAFVTMGFSNHVIAYVRSINGLASEKPPQDNGLMREDSFTYRLYIVNAPMDFETPALWTARDYNAGDLVMAPAFGPAGYWRATNNTTAADVPGGSFAWQRYTYYNHVVAGLQRELRLTFRWPVLPNGNVGNKLPATFRAIVGQTTNMLIPNNRLLYFYEPQLLSPVP